MDINPISMKRIYQSIIEQFIGLIKENKIRFGDKLPSERNLAEMFKVSRASVREAFSAMEIIGLIEVRPGDGSFITNLNIGPFINTIAPLFVDDVNIETDLLDFRMMIEIDAVKLAALNHKNDEIDTLQIQLSHMYEALENNDPDLGADADILFHKGIFILSRNSILIKAAECTASILESSVKFNRAKILKNTANSKLLYDQHREIYTAISHNDQISAASNMEKHLNFVRRIM